jgi:dipeptidyl aminopeptidase/acylaminoacyl peptidase
MVCSGWDNWAFVFLTVAAHYGLSLPNVAAAQQREPLRVEDALKVRTFADLSPIEISPDGKWLAYTFKENSRVRTLNDEIEARTGVPAWVTGANIEILNVESGETRNLTAGQGDNWLPVWSPDGRFLAFLSDRDEGAQAKLWLWDVVRNKLRRVSDVDVRGDKIEWTPDSGKILVTTVPMGLSVEEYVTKRTSTEGNKEEKADTKAPGSTVILYRLDAKEAPISDPWNLDVTLRDLVSVDVANGKATVIAGGHRIAHYLSSPDGSRVAYTIPKRFEKPGSQQILFDLVVITVEAKQERVIASEIRLNYDGASFSWSPDGLKLGFQVGGMEERTYDCYVVDADAGSPRNVSMLQPMSLPSRYKSAAPLWDKTGAHIYFVREGSLWRAPEGQGRTDKVARISDREITHLIAKSESLLWTPDGDKSAIVMTRDDLGKQDGFYRVNLENGRSWKLLESGSCYTCVNIQRYFTVAKDGQRLAFFSEDAQHDTDVWMSAPDFGSPRRLTHLNPQFDEYQMASARLVSWLSEDGEQLQGALLLPSDFRRKERYPLVVWVYGGASLSDRLDRFGLAYGSVFNLQLLATRGYAVLLPDAPQNMATPMLDLAKTVLPGVNKVIEMGIADPDRLGVMGHSFGGYSTLALITQTKRFKAAIEADGFGDFIGAYGQMGKDGTAYLTTVMEQGSGLMGGTPWQFRSRYIENSPVFYLDRVETPLLILHGSLDTSVASFLGDEVFVGLRRLGKEVEYAKYEGEGHSPPYWSYSNQVDVCNRMIAWFNAHLKNRQEH